MGTKNAVAYSLACRPDKVRIILRGWETDRAQQTWIRCIGMIGEMLGWSQAYAERHCVLKSYYHSKAINGYFIQLTYKAATIVSALPAEFAPLVSFIEVKAYLRMIDNRAFDRLLDDFSATMGKYNGVVHQNGSWANRRKGGNMRNFKMGSTKSDLGALWYMRANEYPAIEVNVSGGALDRLIRDAILDDAYRSEANRHPNMLWSRIMRRVGVKGYERVEDEMTHRGMQLKDYATHITEAVTEVEFAEGAMSFRTVENNVSMMQGSLLDVLEQTRREDNSTNEC